jgi:four helix bundle protein
MGSSSEVEYLLLLSRDLNYLNSDAFEQLTAGVTEVKRMLAGLITKVNADRRTLKAEGSR